MVSGSGMLKPDMILATATKLDIKNREGQSQTETQRIKNILHLKESGLSYILKVLSFMSWQVISSFFKRETVFYYPHYPHFPIQERREKQGKPVFPCQPVKLTLPASITHWLNQGQKLNALYAPLVPHLDNLQCKWKLTMLPNKD